MSIRGPMTLLSALLALAALDNVGTAPSNQALSDKRASAVRQYLVESYKVDGTRLSAKGFGARKPAAGNDTAEGRQQNRRVELVRM